MYVGGYSSKILRVRRIGYKQKSTEGMRERKVKSIESKSKIIPLVNIKGLGARRDLLHRFTQPSSLLRGSLLILSTANPMTKSLLEFAKSGLRRTIPFAPLASKCPQLESAVQIRFHHF